MIPARRGAVRPALVNDKGLTELRRLFDEALRCLESTDLPGANTALKKAYVEAASWRRGTTKRQESPRIGGG